MMPTPTHPARFFFLCASTALLVAGGLSACDSSGPEYRPPIPYTADTLAQEFLANYGDLKPKKPGGSPSRKIRAKAVAKEATTKGDSLTKQAESATLTDLIAETLRKAGEIPGTSRADACKKVVEAASKDPSISEGDKKVIVEKLGAVSD